MLQSNPGNPREPVVSMDYIDTLEEVNEIAAFLSIFFCILNAQLRKESPAA